MLEDIRAVSLATHVWNQCCFCEEAEEHIETNGPKGTKIVQYFPSQKFVEVSVKDRLQELKYYCFECLFPRASQDKGKHQDGICQRDFMCKHKSHDKCSVKKQVLVCTY